MTPKEKAFATLAKTMIQNLKKRGMEGHYFDDSASLVSYLKETLPDDSVIAWGGSMSLGESGVMDMLESGKYQLIDRSAAKTPEESRELYSRAVLSDYFFMSTNAITIDGELVNIDGSGNRVACLCHGPSHVFLIVGRNKVTSTLEDAIRRVHDIASPANTVRLGLNTPCSVTGRCADCQSPDCICCQTVVTRHSRQPGRIQVFLVNQELGY